MSSKNSPNSTSTGAPESSGELNGQQVKLVKFQGEGLSGIITKMKTSCSWL